MAKAVDIVQTAVIVVYIIGTVGYWQLLHFCVADVWSYHKGKYCQGQRPSNRVHSTQSIQRQIALLRVWGMFYVMIC